MSETTELKIPPTHSLNDPSVTPDAAKQEGNVTLLPQGDPHHEARMSIAEKYEARRQREIADLHEAAGLPIPGSGGEELSTAADDETRGERPDRGTIPNLQPSQHELRRAAEQAEHGHVPEQHPAEQPAAAPQQHSPPPLHPFQLPDGRTTYVTSEQMNYLAQQGVAALTQQRQPPSLQQWQQYQPQQQPQPQPSQEELDADIVRRFNYGNADEQRAAMADLRRSLMGGRTPDQLVQEAVARAQSVQTVQNNLAILATEYQDIFNSRVLSQVAAVQLNELRQTNPLVPLSNGASVPFTALQELDQYRLASNEVRRAVQSGYAPQQSQPARANGHGGGSARADSQSRIERKRLAPQAPQATDRRHAVDQGPREETRSEIVQKMRQWRGQAV